MFCTMMPVRKGLGMARIDKSGSRNNNIVIRLPSKCAHTSDQISLVRIVEIKRHLGPA